MKVGKFDIEIVNAGYFAMDCGAVFGVVPKALWQNKVECDENNRILMSLNCLLLESGNRKILVDTGIGNGVGKKIRKIFKIEDTTNIELSLNEFGIKPEDITDVISTHLHFDHAGGLMNHKTGNLFFSNARYYVSETQFNWANNPTCIDRASYAKRNFNPVFESSQGQLLKNGEQPIDGMKFYYTNGHTPGMITIEVEDEKTPIFYCSDIFPSSHHIKINYISAYDLIPLSLIKEKEFFLKKVYNQNGIIIFPHDAIKQAVSIEKMNNDYQINKSFNTIGKLGQ